jgi:hypothetical protein
VDAAGICTVLREGALRSDDIKSAAARG